jgi:hypothetical protein
MIENKSLNDLALNVICPNLSSYQDKFVKFKDALVTYDYLEILDFIDDQEFVIGMLTKYILSVWFDDLNQTVNTLDSVLTKAFFSIYDVNDENNKAYSRMFIRLVQIMDAISSLLEHADYVVPNLEFYKTIGIDFRRYYKSLIDLVIVNKDSTVSLFIIAPRTASNSTAVVAAHPKVNFAIDYCREAGIKVSSVYFLGYSESNISKDIVIQKININDTVNSVHNNLMNIRLHSAPNMFFCAMCPYRSLCTITDFKRKP